MRVIVDVMHTVVRAIHQTFLERRRGSKVHTTPTHFPFISSWWGLSIRVDDAEVAK